MFNVQVHAWEIADQLLLLKRDMVTSHFAAQTMQNKVRFSFEELPQQTHVVNTHLQCVPVYHCCSLHTPVSTLSVQSSPLTCMFVCFLPWLL